MSVLHISAVRKAVSGVIQAASRIECRMFGIAVSEGSLHTVRCGSVISICISYVFWGFRYLTTLHRKFVCIASIFVHSPSSAGCIARDTAFEGGRQLEASGVQL